MHNGRCTETCQAGGVHYSSGWAAPLDAWQHPMKHTTPAHPLPPSPHPPRAYREERQRWQLVGACLEHCELTLTSLRSGENLSRVAAAVII